MKTYLLRAWHGGLFACLFFGSAVSAKAQAPASNLTVTVTEQSNGGVAIQLSGTANTSSLFFGYLDGTAYDGEQSLPPHTLDSFLSHPLPPGLTLSVPYPILASEPESGEGGPEAALPDESIPLTTIQFTPGFWYLGGFSPRPVFPLTSITGSGSVVVDDLPFSHFVPGTYVVASKSLALSQPESGDGPEEVPGDINVFYTMTYKVIPLAKGSARLRMSTPRAFRRTAVNRSGGSRTVRVRNQGSVAAQNFSAAAVGPHAGDFTVLAPAIRSIPPQGEARLLVKFRPRAVGRRRADLKVTSSAPAVTSRLRGTGVFPLPHSPRFPRGSR